MLLGLGLGVSGVGVIDPASLGAALKGFITVAIGLLIYEGALHLNRDELSHAPRAVVGLLTIGALVTWVTAAVAAHIVLELSWPLATLLGATLTVTGPTVVQPILRMMPVSRRLHTALSAEAVLVDPIGVVATIATLDVIRLMTAKELGIGLAGEGAWLFIKPMLGGAGVGVVMGLAGQLMLRASSHRGGADPSILNLIAVGTCMTCVGIGESITPEGGLVAVTVCGVLMARVKVLGATDIRAFKELLAVMLVGTLFVLLSAKFDVGTLAGLSWHMAMFVGALLFVVRPLAVLLSTIGSRLSVRERVFACTFAPRGIVALSVASVVALELGTPTASMDGAQQEDGRAALAAEAARLEPIMFTVIAGTVLMGSTFSPLLAWLLRLKPGEDESVVIVGGHAFGRALAHALRDAGIRSRIIDTNIERVSLAQGESIDALEGDATDARWMEDLGAPFGAGHLLALTGNHDVDQIAARWAQKRFGVQRAAIWSARAVRGPLDSNDMSKGEPITDLIDRLRDKSIRVAVVDDPSECERLLGWVKDARLYLALPGVDVPKASPGIRFIGLVASTKRSDSS